MSFAPIPYSPEEKGDLLEYLRGCDRNWADNMFVGPRYFFAIRDLGIMVPDHTLVRVANAFTPDPGYWVNRNFMLESNGPGEYNPHMMMAAKGVYEPRRVLRSRRWSISGLRLWDEQNMP